MTVGTLVTCVATVTATSPGAGTPTGQLKFLVDGTGVLPNGTLDATGHATFTSSTLAVGAHTVKAAYAGNANVLASSAQVTENVNPVQFASTTSLVCTPASVTSTQNVTCTATVRSPTGPGTPTGPRAVHEQRGQPRRHRPALRRHCPARDHAVVREPRDRRQLSVVQVKVTLQIVDGNFGHSGNYTYSITVNP